MKKPIRVAALALGAFAFLLVSVLAVTYVLEDMALDEWERNINSPEMVQKQLDDRAKLMADESRRP